MGMLASGGGGSSETRELAVKAKDGGGKYEITITGRVVGKSSLEGGDKIGEGTISGAIAKGWEDKYEITGSVSNADIPNGVVVTLDGQPVNSTSWNPPQVVESLNGGWNLVSQTNGEDTRYAVLGTTDGVKYDITPNGTASPAPNFEKVYWYSRESSARTAWKKHQDRNQPTDKAWSTPRRIKTVGGWHVYKQERDSDSRFFAAGIVNGKNRFLGKDARPSETPSFYGKAQKLADTLSTAIERQKNGSQPSPSGEQPNGSVLETTRAKTTAGTDFGSSATLVGGVVIAAAAVYAFSNR